MIIACVHVHVKAEHREAFIKACLDNARNTIQEPGNLRFDVLEQADDPNRFMLYEVYRDEAGSKAHKATAHYARWAETVKDWLAETRYSVKYNPLFPENPEQWQTREE
ncbi:MAG TPA: putative quinol monooxygenase [Thermoguttaceae bacterium]